MRQDKMGEGKGKKIEKEKGKRSNNVDFSFKGLGYSSGLGA